MKRYKFTGVVDSIGCLTGPKKPDGTRNYLSLVDVIGLNKSLSFIGKTLTVEVVFLYNSAPIYDMVAGWRMYKHIISVRIMDTT